MPHPDIDPWTPDLEAFLDRLTPEDELVYRLTLQGEYPRLKGRLEWCERTRALLNEILTFNAAWDRVLAKVRAKTAELFKRTSAQSAAPLASPRRANRTSGRRGAGRGRSP